MVRVLSLKVELLALSWKLKVMSYEL